MKSNSREDSPQTLKMHERNTKDRLKQCVPYKDFIVCNFTDK